MKDFKYKCVVTKNGNKLYYKRVRDKWKRISNKLGIKAENKYRFYKNPILKNLNCDFENLINEMKKYKTTNTGFHVGENLFEHSAWTALQLEKWFGEKNFYVKHIDKDYKDLTILCGFLHDIGKLGDGDICFYDKPDHPEIGYKYLNGDEFEMMKDIWSGDKSTTNIDKLLPTCLETYDYKKIKSFIKISIAMHYKFGDTIRKRESKIVELKHSDDYEKDNKILNNIETKKVKFDDDCKTWAGYLYDLTRQEKNDLNDHEIIQLGYICIAVSTADVAGSGCIEHKSNIGFLKNLNCEGKKNNDMFTKLELDKKEELMQKMYNGINKNS